MLVEINQKIGVGDKSPDKEALLNSSNIMTALNSIYPDEDFEVKIIRSESGGSVSCKAHRPDIEELMKEWDLLHESEMNYLFTKGKGGNLFDRRSWVEKRFRELLVR